MYATHCLKAAINGFRENAIDRDSWFDFLTDRIC
jgi:hypothetical protein